MEQAKEPKTIKGGDVVTFTDDLVKVIEEDRTGLIKKIIHEQEENDARKNRESPISKRNKIFTVLGIFLFLASFLAVFFVFVLSRQNVVTPFIQLESPFMFTDDADFLSIDGLSKEEIGKKILDKMQTAGIAPGEVVSVYLTENEKAISFQKFIKIAKLHIDDEAMKSIDGLLLGGVKMPNATKVVAEKKEKITNIQNVRPFILMRVRSFVDIFPFMQLWEKKIFSDLREMFGRTEASDNYLRLKEWEDSVILNKNARVLKTQDLQMVMMYVFVNDRYLLIADSTDTVAEVMSRLFSSRIKK